MDEHREEREELEALAREDEDDAREQDAAEKMILLEGFLTAWGVRP